MCELREYVLEFIVMYKTEMPHINGMKDVQREGIKLCVIFRLLGLFGRRSGFVS